jgi:hypothetical protein
VIVNKDSGVSLVVVSSEPVPPPKKYVLTLDHDHMEFLQSLLRHVQTCNKAGHLSYDIYTTLSGQVPYKELKLKQIARLGNVEVDYNDDKY